MEENIRNELHRRLSKLESLPEYASLGFEDQANARREIIVDTAKNSPSFMQLNQADQWEAIDSVAMSRRPVFENPEINQVVDRHFEAAERGELQPHDMQSVAFTRGLLDQSLFANIAVVPLLRRVNQAIQNINPEAPDIMLPVDAYTGKDGDKFISYLRAKALEQGDGVSPARGYEFFGNIVGFAGDFLTFHKAWVGLTGKHVAAASARLAGQTIGKKAWAARVALPAAVSGTSSGMFGIFKEHFLGTVHEDDKRRQDTFRKIASTFGQYAVLDYALNLTIGSFGHVKLLKHVARKKGKSLGDMSFDDRQLLIKQATEGRAPSEIMNQLDKPSRNYIYAQEALQNLQVDDAIRLRPMDDLVYRASRAGGSVYFDPDEKLYYLFFSELDSPMTAQGIPNSMAVAEDMVKAKRLIARKLADKYKGLTGDEALMFKAENEHFLNLAYTERAIDALYDPRRFKDTGLSQKIRAFLSPKHVDKGYVSPANRPYVSGEEASRYMRAIGSEEVPGVVRKMKVGFSEEQLANIAKGDLPYQGHRAVTLTDGTGEIDTLAVVRKPADPESIEKATRMAQRAVRGGALQDELYLRNMYLMEGGFDGIVHPDGRTVEMFFPDKLKIIGDQVNPATGRIGAFDAFDARGTKITRSISAQGEFEAKFSAEDLVSNRKLLRDATLQTFEGKIDPDTAQSFGRTFARGAGLDPNAVTIKLSRKINAIEDGVPSNVAIKDGKAVITVPKEITSPGAQRKFLASFLDDLEEAVTTLKAQGYKAKLRPLGEMVAGKDAQRLGVKKAQIKAPFTSEAANRRWIQEVVEDMGGSFSARGADGYEVLIPKLKRSIKAQNINELTDKLMLSTMDTNSIRYDLSMQGYNLRKVVDGNYVLQGKGVMKTSDNLMQLLDEVGYRPKISNEFAPKIAKIDPDAVLVKYGHGEAVGDFKGLKQALSKFEDPSMKAMLKPYRSLEHGQVFAVENGGYRVNIPEIGVEGMEFSSPGEAVAFVNKHWDTYTGLKKVARRAGLEMSYDTKQGIHIIDPDGKAYTAATRQEAHRILAQYPDATGARELAEGIDPESLSAIDKVLLNYDVSKLPELDQSMFKVYPDFAPEALSAKELTMRQSARRLLENTDWFMEKTMKDIGRSDILRSYRNVETTFRAAHVEEEAVNKTLAAIFSTEKGKILPLDRRKAIFYHAGAQTEGEAVQAMRVYGELTDFEQARVLEVRQLLDGLAKKFSVPREMLLNNYMPRIKTFAAKNKDLINKMTTAEELFDATYKNVHGTSIKPQLKAFFKNMRTSDVLAFEAVDDPLKAISMYSRVGHRQLYMGQAWEDLYASLKVGEVPAGVRRKMDRYRELMMGVHSTDGQQHMGEFGNALGKTLGFKDGEELMQAYFSVNYLSNMGWRPWLAVRNTTQIWTTLAPRMGNEWVKKAVKTVNNMGEAEYEYLKKIGVIFDAPPLVNEILDVDSAIGRITHKGLGMFKSSDEITRAIAFNTAGVRFDDALGKLKRGVIKNVDVFAKEAGVTKMDSDTIDLVKRLMRTGTDESIAAARTAYGTKVVNDTMFQYRRPQAPDIYTGSFLGRLFGQYGTYSAGYRANIMRGLTQGSAGDKAAFVARFLYNQTALFAAASAVGIRATNFVPGMPALFGGGPNWEVGVAAMEMFAPDYRGEQARAKLNRFFSPIGHSKSEGFRFQYPERMPGSLQLRYVQQAMEYWDQGDEWRAFLALTTTPVLPADEMPFFLQ